MPSAKAPPNAMPMGEENEISDVVSPMARPIFSLGTWRCTRVIIGPLYQALATAITPHRATKAGKAVGGSRPQATVEAPTTSVATATRRASFLPPPVAMRMPDPTIMPRAEHGLGKRRHVAVAAEVVVGHERVDGTERREHDHDERDAAQQHQQPAVFGHGAPPVAQVGHDVLVFGRLVAHGGDLRQGEARTAASARRSPGT